MMIGEFSRGTPGTPLFDGEKPWLSGEDVPVAIHGFSGDRLKGPQKKKNAPGTPWHGNSLRASMEVTAW